MGVRVAGSVVRARAEGSGERGAGRAGLPGLAGAVAVAALVLVVAGCSGGASHAEMMASQQATWDAQRSAAASASASAAASAAAVVSASAAAEGLSVEEWGLKQEALATAAPVMPELATYNTPEGRGAAAEYFAALFPYVYATGDLTEWKAMSEEGCQYCQNVVNSVETLHAKGGWVDPWEPTIAETTIYVQNEGYDYAAVEVTIDQPAGLRHNGDGTTETIEANPDVTLHLTMRWNGERWVVGKGKAS